MHNQSKLSAFEAMEGMYSFDATPMAPVGTETLIHLKPIRRQSWGYHAMKGWYFAPALKHYRVIKTVTDTGLSDSPTRSNSNTMHCNYQKSRKLTEL